jgi:hypothetical protein
MKRGWRKEKMCRGEDSYLKKKLPPFHFLPLDGLRS